MAISKKEGFTFKMRKLFYFVQNRKFQFETVLQQLPGSRYSFRSCLGAVLRNNLTRAEGSRRRRVETLSTRCTSRWTNPAMEGKSEMKHFVNIKSESDKQNQHWQKTSMIAAYCNHSLCYQLLFVIIFQRFHLLN